MRIGDYMLLVVALILAIIGLRIAVTHPDRQESENEEENGPFYSSDESAYFHMHKDRKWPAKDCDCWHCSEMREIIQLASATCIVEHSVEWFPCDIHLEKVTALMNRSRLHMVELRRPEIDHID